MGTKEEAYITEMRKCVLRVKALESALEMLLEWDDFGGDAPEMLADTVAVARALLGKPPVTRDDLKED